MSKLMVSISDGEESGEVVIDSNEISDLALLGEKIRVSLKNANRYVFRGPKVSVLYLKILHAMRIEEEPTQMVGVDGLSEEIDALASSVLV